MSNDAIESLKEAVRISPSNLPLRVLLADALATAGSFEAAEAEYTTAISMAPDDLKILIGLAQVCFDAGKHSKSEVIVEDVLRRSDPPARAHLLYARILLNEGQVQRARESYHKAFEKDSSTFDSALAEQLEITPEGKKARAKAQDEGGRVPAEAHPSDEDDEDDDDDDDAKRLIEISRVDFADIGGMDQVKDQIRMKIIHPLTHADTFKAYGKKIGGGLLMYGPPGCGKTHLARATAGEIKAKFISVGLHEVLDMWLGRSEQNLHKIFEMARYNKPCVLFFDEVDALGASRSDLKASSTRNLVNQFLSELDGVDSSNDGVLVLAATNAPWHVDAAFRRPGRFDRVIFVPPPDAPARSSILKILLRDKPVDNIDYDGLGKKTDKLSGADLKLLVDDAIEHKIAEAMKVGVPKPITTKDLERSMKIVKPTTLEWFSTARNYAVFSNEGGIYDDILKYLKIH